MSVLEPTVHRFTRDEYYRMADAGLFDGRRVELIEGEIIDMAPQQDAHGLAVTFVDYALRRVFGQGYTVRVQLPMDLGESQPEPDLAILLGDPREQVAHPTSAVLVVEVADTTLAYDRRVKALLYALAAVPEYWILDLTARRLEIRRDPGQSGYQSLQTFDATAAVSPLAATASSIRVADLLP